MRYGTACGSKRVSFITLPARYRERFCICLLSSTRFQPEPENKATWHFASRLLLALAIAIGRIADAAAKQRAEGPETLKADLETHVRHAEPIGTKQLFGLLDSSLDQVLVWRGGECVAK